MASYSHFFKFELQDSKRFDEVVDSFNFVSELAYLHIYLGIVRSVFAATRKYGF